MRRFNWPALFGWAALILLSPLAAAERLTIVSWGGAYERSQSEAYFKPFTAASGIDIAVEQYNGGIEELRQQVESGQHHWDLLDMNISDNMQACALGLLEPIDHASLPPAPDGTPAAVDFLAGSLTPCGVSEVVSATVLAFNSQAFPGEKPSRIEDLFDLAKFPGKRALQDKPIATLEWALLAYGVPLQDLYNLLSTERGLQLAFAKLDQIKKHIVWWTSASEPPQLLASGEVAMASGYNGRFFNAAVVDGHPIHIIWDGQLYEYDGWGIAKNSPNRKLAMQFIQFATGTQPLADQAKYIAYGPARKSSAKLIWQHALSGIDMRPHLPTYPANFRTAIQKDDEWYARTQKRLIERFNLWQME